jgi:hypothetical protein
MYDYVYDWTVPIAPLSIPPSKPVTTIPPTLSSQLIAKRESITEVKPAEPVRARKTEILPHSAQPVAKQIPTRRITIQSQETEGLRKKTTDVAIKKSRPKEPHPDENRVLPVRPRKRESKWLQASRRITPRRTSGEVSVRRTLLPSWMQTQTAGRVRPYVE